jgi:hypothetical protein
MLGYTLFGFFKLRDVEIEKSLTVPRILGIFHGHTSLNTQNVENYFKLKL